jgi:hypothetical protein
MIEIAMDFFNSIIADSFQLSQTMKKTRAFSKRARNIDRRKPGWPLERSEADHNQEAENGVPAEPVSPH